MKIIDIHFVGLLCMSVVLIHNSNEMKTNPTAFFLIVSDFMFRLTLSPCACFFICAVVIFQIYKENCI